MALPVMKVSHRMDAHEFVVAVEHDPRQSYSRAVDPRALRYARTHLRGQWKLTRCNYDAPAPEGRAVSEFHFARLA